MNGTEELYTANTSLGFQQQPIGKIVVDGLGAFTPLDDITAKEVSLLMVAFIFVVNCRFGSYDVKGYIEQQGLSRHFSEAV